MVKYAKRLNGKLKFILWCNLKRHIFGQTEAHAHNSTFAIGGVSCSADPPSFHYGRAGSFVVKESAVLRMNICAEKPAHRKSAERYRKPFAQLIKYYGIKKRTLGKGLFNQTTA